MFVSEYLAKLKQNSKNLGYDSGFRMDRFIGKQGAKKSRATFPREGYCARNTVHMLIHFTQCTLNSRVNYVHIKETIARDFRSMVFFIKRTHPGA